MRTLLKVLGVVAIVVVAAAVMLTVTGLYFARHVHVKESGEGDDKTVNIDSPFGHLTVRTNQKLEPEAVGIPVYPGASRAIDKEGASFEFDAGDLHKDWTISAASFYTSDSPEQVQRFYRDKLPSWHEVHKPNRVRIETKIDSQHIRSIEIRREDGRTRIGVASIGPPAAN